MIADRPILVTGAAGLIGRGVVESLRSQGRPVKAVDSTPPHERADFTVEIADLRDHDRMAGLVARGLDGIVHCGGISGPMVAYDQPSLVAETNVCGTIALLGAALQHKAGRFVYCSSVSAYGATPAGMDPVPETAPLNATDTYGASKAAPDLLARALAAQHGLDVVVVRIGWVYGPRRRTENLPRTLLRDALARSTTVVPNDGSFRVQLVYVDDVVRALVRALDTRGIGGRAYTITGGTRIPETDLADIAQRVLPQAEVRFTPGIVSAEPVQARFDISAAARDLDWEPQVSLEEGLGRYAEWLRRNEY